MSSLHKNNLHIRPVIYCVVAGLVFLYFAFGVSVFVNDVCTYVFTHVRGIIHVPKELPNLLF